jgi:hypothetical protein
MLGSIFYPSFSVETEDIPEYVKFLRMLNSCIRERKCTLPEDYMGLNSLLWHIIKVRDGRPFISFGGKVRILKGVEEIRLPRRKALVILAVLRSLGMEGLRAMAPHIFPTSAHPIKTVYDYMRFLREYRYSPTNLKFALNSGYFLYDETEPWAEMLKDKLRDMGKLKPPIIAGD